MDLSDLQAIHPVTPYIAATLRDADALRQPPHHVTLTCAADVDAGALQQALDVMIGGHERLRASYLIDGVDEPLLLVHKAVAATVRTDSGPDAAGRALDATRAPLFDASLTVDGAGRRQVHLRTHPCVIDAASTIDCARAWLRLYDAIVRGTPPPIVVGTRCVGAREGPSSDQEQYWRTALFGRALGGARLTRPRPDRRGADASIPRRCVHAHALSPTSRASIERHERQEGRPSGVVAAAAWAVLLARLDGQPQSSFGVQVPLGGTAARPAADVLNMSAAVVPCVCDVPWQEEVDAWIDALGRQMALMGAEAAPLGTITRWGEHAGALFDTVVLATRLPAAASFPSIVIDVEVVPSDAFLAPVTIALRDGSPLSMQLSHEVDALTCSRARQLLQQAEDILRRMGPGATIANCSTAGAHDRETLAHWRVGPPAAARGSQADASITARFRVCAARCANAVALRCGDATLTYAELDERSTRLAAALRRCGVGPDICVGLYLERGVDAIVALLAVLKAGGAYAPLDPDYPMSRIQHMIETCGLPIVLTTSALEPQLPITSAFVRCLDGDLDALLEGDEVLSPAVASPPPEALAYIVFTSGSTGRPKGVMVPHRGLTNLAAAQNELFGIGEGTRVLQFASPSFDASVSEWATTLTAGGTLVLPPDRSWLSGERLLELCRHERINVVTLPPSILATLPDDPLPDLTTLVVAGERCLPDLASRWAAGRRVINAYGPSETTVAAAMSLPIASVAETLPIGRPFSGISLHVLDERGAEVPIGAAGELYVGGVGVGRGYRGDAARTAERFLPDEFSREPGTRLYRTGDRVRWNEDAQLEFLGRCDRQVKVHGFRIEPEEIEAVLCAHEAVRDATVDAIDEPGRVSLVAWVVARADTPQPTVTELQDRLSARLPPYMIPRAFVFLDALPVTPNGKVDRARLPAPAAGRPALGHDAVAPRTEPERLLATIWSEVLGLPQVGIHDNFFALGGDSIQSIQIVARANEVGLHVTAQDCFDHQTIAELAAVAVPTTTAGGRRGPRRTRAKLTPIQQWFVTAQPRAALHHYNQSVLLDMPAPIDPDVLDRAVAALVARHASLRFRFDQTASGWTQRLSSADEHRVYGLYDLSALPAPLQRPAFRAIATRLHTSLDIERGPLLRFAHVRFGRRRADRLFVTIHHLATDGYTWRILLRELQTLCRDIEAAAPADDHEEWTSFLDWAAVLEEEALAPRWIAQAAWWDGVLASTSASVPLDDPDAANTRASAAELTVELSDDETASLLREAPAAYGTQINDVLLTAFAMAVTQWTGQPRCLFDLEGHGRQQVRADVDVSRTTGWFTTCYPVAIEMADPEDLAGTLTSVKEQLRRTPDQGFGYGLLRHLGGDALAGYALSDRPAPSLLFNYLGQMDHVLTEGALFRPLADECGDAQSRIGIRHHVVELNALIAGGRLRAAWSYSRHLHRESTIRRLAESFLDALRAIVRQCQAQERRVYTPSDFPDVDLTQHELQDILAVIDAADGKR